MENKLNFMQAYHAFMDYLQQYDLSDPKINLKLIHTLGVVNCAEKIGDRMELDSENWKLAKIIALLHDIGRFEQVRLYDSFEPTTMDHAEFGVNYLFGPENHIREFVTADTYDEIIKTAIGHHSDYELPYINNEQTAFHAKLIRDADKLDNCRVKLESSVELLLGETPEQVGSEKIADRVWESCLNGKSVKSADRVTKMDYWVSYLAYFFDINYKETFDIIMENNYIDRLIAVIPYSNEDTKDKICQLRKMLFEKY